MRAEGNEKAGQHLKEIEGEVLSMLEEMGTIFTLISAAFKGTSTAPLDEATVLAKKLHNKEKGLTARLVEIARKNQEESPEIEALISVPSHLERMGDYAESIISCTRSKISEGMLFSDKANDELGFLFTGGSKLLKSLRDAVVTRNEVLIGHIQEEGEHLWNQASLFASEHERRLVTGVCMPKHSSVFLDILDSMKQIVGHAKEIVTRLA
jgi:Na+/phosphate symporter